MFGWLNQFWMNWLLAGRRAEARDDGAGRWKLDTVGRYRFSSLLFMGLWVVLAAGVTLDAWLRPEDATRRREEAAAWFSLFVVPLAMALFGIVDAWWARVTIEPTGLRFQYPWRPGALVRWEDIVQIRHRESFHWFTIRRRGGAAIRIAETRHGLGRLRRELRRHVDPLRWAAAAARLPRLDADDGVGGSEAEAGARAG